MTSTSVIIQWETSTDTKHYSERTWNYYFFPHKTLKLLSLLQVWWFFMLMIVRIFSFLKIYLEQKCVTLIEWVYPLLNLWIWTQVCLTLSYCKPTFLYVWVTASTAAMQAFCPWLYCIFPPNQWSSISHAPHHNTGHSWLNAVFYGMCPVLSAVEPFIQGLCWLMSFCFAAVSRGCLCAQRKLCSVLDTSENQHNCTNCSQFLTEWTPLSHLTTSRGTRISHGPPDRDERE